MSLPKNVGELDHNIRMFLGLPALIVAVESAMVFQAYVVAVVSLLVGAAIYATGALRYSPLYHVLNVDTRLNKARERN